jgi:hypothetical protein
VGFCGLVVGLGGGRGAGGGGVSTLLGGRAKPGDEARLAEGEEDDAEHREGEAATERSRSPRRRRRRSPLAPPPPSLFVTIQAGDRRAPGAARRRQTRVPPLQGAHLRSPARAPQFGARSAPVCACEEAGGRSKGRNGDEWQLTRREAGKDGAARDGLGADRDRGAARDGARGLWCEKSGGGGRVWRDRA